MKRSKLISLVLTFSLIATTIMTGCSSESYKDTSTSTATTYESAPSSNYRTDDISDYDVTYGDNTNAGANVGTVKITAKGKGTATIYVYSRNGYAKKVKVTVK